LEKYIFLFLIFWVEFFWHLGGKITGAANCPKDFFWGIFFKKNP
jgi:hypothetical protein